MKDNSEPQEDLADETTYTRTNHIGPKTSV